LQGISPRKKPLVEMTTNVSSSHATFFPLKRANPERFVRRVVQDRDRLACRITEAPLNQTNRFSIVPRMKNVLAFLFSVAVCSAPLAAQTMSAGVMLGRSNEVNDGLNLHLDDSAREIWLGLELEPSTNFGLKIGQIDSDDGPRVGAPGISQNGKIEYINALVEYRFSEVFGSTGLFAGPGYYRQRFGVLEETNYGLSGGVNAIFPVTRKIGLTAEVAYHWVNFDEASRFLTASGGVRLGF
jgi:hypothetical protein